MKSDNTTNYELEYLGKTNTIMMQNTKTTQITHPNLKGWWWGRWRQNYTRAFQYILTRTDQ